MGECYFGVFCDLLSLIQGEQECSWQLVIKLTINFTIFFGFYLVGVYAATDSIKKQVDKAAVYWFEQGILHYIAAKSLNKAEIPQEKELQEYPYIKNAQKKYADKIEPRIPL